MQTISNLRNHLLIAVPGMQDSYFDHTVTLVCQHDDQGAFGVTINRPLELTVGELLSQLDIEVLDPVVAGLLAVSGGPIQQEQGFVLHDGGLNWDSTLEIATGLFLTSSRDILVDLAKGEGPEHFLLILGCSGWSPGQLENELKENTWLIVPSTSELLFATPFPERWRGAASLMGIDVSLLGSVAGHA
ncbi:MAG: YqgE/AlgH family protein [Proteobacteria bacterium]|nr:MAG: YqgE/AlgH family protein [Pseudomonadota bacterium]